VSRREFFFKSGDVVLRVKIGARIEASALDTVTGGYIENTSSDTTGTNVLANVPDVKLARLAAMIVMKRGIGARRILRSHAQWRATERGPRLVLIPITADGDTLNGLGAWSPVVVKGEGQNADYGVPSGQDPAYVDFREGVRAAAYSDRVYDDHYEKPRAWQRGFALVRRLKKEHDDAGITHLLWLVSRPKKRMHPSDNPRYAVKNRGARGSGKGAWTHVGGKRMGTVRRLAMHFALSDGPAYCKGALWTDGVVLYSYMQPIARKRVLAASYPAWHAMRVAEIDGRTFSPTTTNHQNHARAALSHGGWHVEQRDIHWKKS
jgi:hypothetical protein